MGRGCVMRRGVANTVAWRPWAMPSSAVRIGLPDESRHHKLQRNSSFFHMNTATGVSRSFFRGEMGEKFRWDELTPAKFFQQRDVRAYEVLPALRSEPPVYIEKYVV